MGGGREREKEGKRERESEPGVGGIETQKRGRSGKRVGGVYFRD